MKKLNKLGYMAIGVVLTLIIGTATPVFAVTKDVVKQLTAYFTSGGKPITVYVNGNKVVKDSNGKAAVPFTVDGTTYLPVRALAEALGKEVKWDGTTASVKINDKVTPTPIPAPTSDTSDNNTSKIVVTKDDKGVIHESMDYVFVPDKDAVGQWEQIDYVATFDQFDSKDTTRRKYIEIGIHNFYEDGREIFYADKTRGTGETKWTKGYVWGGDDTISSYEIKQLDGKTFMFIQWKSDDYTVRGQVPCYYVYVKTSDIPDPEFVK